MSTVPGGGAEVPQPGPAEVGGPTGRVGVPELTPGAMSSAVNGTPEAIRLMDQGQTPTNKVGEFDTGKYADQMEQGQRVYDAVTDNSERFGRAPQDSTRGGPALYGDQPVSGEQKWAKPTTDADALQHVKGSEVGLTEKPTNTVNLQDYYRTEAARFLEPLTQEQREALSRDAREFVKARLEVKDTADLTPKVQEAFKAFDNWLTGKTVK